MPRLAFAAPFALALTAAASAHAQPAFAPPGECDCPAPAAVVAAAPMPELPRWSIGLALTSTSLADKNTPDQPSEWGGGEWRLGFRVFPHWELGLELGGAVEKLAGDQDGRKLGMSLLTVKWHPAPYARWDFYAIAGAGAAAITEANASDPNPKADRGAGMLGIGLERRWGHIGVSAELRGLGISPVDPSANDPQATPLVAGSTTTTPTPAADNGLGGGSFSLAASYEF